MDLSEKNAAVKVTQQILKQGENRAALEFLKIPEEVKNSGKYSNKRGDVEVGSHKL